ncbi:hypothetical protein A9Q92_04920 [Methylophaga sp. 42_8_T64]|nr:hypothetical protein A9Q78_06845 [Methylophaga sp. 41_12_T18]OUR87027.1 hypothetical protein A9Q92_04920 [Methylophaga sp. 42_8_T64]
MAVIVVTVAGQWLYNQSSTAAQQQQLTDIEQQLTNLQQQRQMLRADNQQLQQTNTTQQTQITELQQYLSLQQATDQQLQMQLVELQGKVITLNKELVFYQTVTQGNNSSKLQVRELDLSANKSQAGYYHYRLVITQGKKLSKPLTGDVAITVNGKTTDGTAKKINAENKSLQLRHVQVIEGQLKIADNIEPISITIAIKPKKNKTVSQTLDWQIEDKH